MASRWFKQWKKVIGYDLLDKADEGKEFNYPGPIDNTSLFEGEIIQYIKELCLFLFLC